MNASQTQPTMWPLPVRLRVARLRIVLEVHDLMELPPHKGGLLRGLIGLTLKRLTCAQREGDACPPCRMGNACPYGYLIEPRPAPGQPADADRSDPPAPFLIEPPEDQRLLYRRGETLEFALVLFGRGIQYQPYLLLALEELGRQGIGRRRARFHLASADVEPAETAPGGDLGAAELTAQAAGWPDDALTVRYLTPARLRHRMQYVTVPEFPVLIRALERRIGLLAATHADEAWRLDPGAPALAEGVRIERARTDWVVRDRYAPRQRQGMSLSGLVGEVRYSGPVGPFRALLALGAYSHVGKAAVFGNGRIAIGGMQNAECRMQNDDDG